MDPDDLDAPDAPDASGLVCIHNADTLCEACYAEYCGDPLAWLEYGDHPEGIENTKRLYAQIEADAREREEEHRQYVERYGDQPPDTDIPF